MKRRERGLFTPRCVSLSSLSMNNTQTKKRNIHRRGGGTHTHTQKICPPSLKRYLFTCWSCFYKELLIAAFLKRTFLLSLLFLSWNKWDTNILQGQNILYCLVVSVCNLSSVILNYINIYIYTHTHTHTVYIQYIYYFNTFLNVNLVFL